MLEGGGVKGIAYAGAFAALDKQGILAKIEKVAGTSAGAIQATLVALGYSPDDIRRILFNLDFKRFEDGGATGLWRLWRRFGWYRGDYYLELMRCLVAEKTGGKPRATFADLHDLGLRELHVFASDLNAGTAQEYSYETTPGFEVALAARTSGSFPLFFAAIRSQGRVLVDGGVLRNYPIDAFDPERGVNRHTLGLVLENTAAPPPLRRVDGLLEYAEALSETILDVQVQALATNPPDLERTVIVNDLGVSTLDFELTDAQKSALVAQGEECTCNYLRDWHRWSDGGFHPGDRRLEPGESIPIRHTDRCGSAFPAAPTTASR